MAVRKFSTPGVYRQEIDLSESVAPAGTSTGAIVMRSVSGPINRPVLVSSEKELYETFGKPVFTSGVNGITLSPTNLSQGIPDNGYGMYAAIEFLKESNALYVGRVVDTTDKFAGLYVKSGTYDPVTSATCQDIGNASTGVSGIGIASIPYVKGNQFDRLDNNTSIETSAGLNVVWASSDLLIAAQAPGAEGNNIAVSIETFTGDCDWVYKYDGYPTSGYVSAGSQVIAEKVIRIDVYVKETTQTWDSIKTTIKGYQTNTSGATSANGLRDFIAPVETFYGTLVSQLDAEGRQLKLTNVVNGNSKYIYVKDSNATAKVNRTTTGLTLKWYHLMALGGGAVNALKSCLGDDSTELGNILAAWNIFESREFIPNINLLINCDWNASVKQRVAEIAATRMDCLAFGQSGKLGSDTVATILSEETYGYVNPSYMALYAGYDKIYDATNDKYFYIPKAAFGPALCARTDNVANTWDAPAGQARGIIPSIGQKAVFTTAQIGQLYDRNINTSTTQPGIGSYMLGQKTAQLKQTSMSRINCRRGLLFIENSVEPLLNAFLFELNNDRTRQRVTINVDSFLSDVQAAGGLINKLVVCDTTNNTIDTINNNQLIVDLYVQLPTTIEFILMRAIISRSGASIQRI